MTISSDATSDRLRRLAQRLHAKAGAESESIGICANQHDKIVHSLNVELNNARRDCARYRDELESLRSKESAAST